MDLNILFIGRASFPDGFAMTKRHRYIIDYLINRNIRVSKYSSWQTDGISNPPEGHYKGKVFFKNTRHPKSLLSIFKISRETCAFLRENYSKAHKNITIFSSTLSIEEFIPWIYASVKGYKIFFDVVENYASKGGDTTFSTKFHLFISKIAYRKAAGIFAISSLLDKKYRTYTKSNICILPNSAVACFENNKKSFSTPFRVTYTGTFASKDGVKYLVEGFQRFIQQQKVNAELFLAGKGEADSSTEKIIRQNPRIKKLGYISDGELSELIRNSDVLAMTRCNSEFANYGFPFKLSEYLATGNTVVATNVGDVSSYLTDRQNAYIIPPDNSQAITDVLNHVYTHEDEAIRIGKNGQQVVRTHFDPQVNGDRFLDFIKQQTL